MIKTTFLHSNFTLNKGVDDEKNSRNFIFRRMSTRDDVCLKNLYKSSRQSRPSQLLNNHPFLFKSMQTLHILQLRSPMDKTFLNDWQSQKKYHLFSTYSFNPLIFFVSKLHQSIKSLFSHQKSSPYRNK